MMEDCIFLMLFGLMLSVDIERIKDSGFPLARERRYGGLSWFAIFYLRSSIISPAG
jgi:hypothetical protein